MVVDSLEKELFLQKSVIGSYKDGHEYIVFDPNIHQIALNPKRHTFRIQNDRQDEYFHIEMDSYPRSLGVNIISSFVLKRGGENKEYSFVLECSKIEDGKLWLWSKENKLGIIIPQH